ncbi:TetR/AcrR family transcriptional regulator [Streptomyces sp. 549]|uniref:TetR/AcrR family transcriptional regulator n=1 Tax=Streptomyces sp. 549 TaxID=3049076 RepID=UPI0024C373B0|nr:TetR/AcrR family transcriptional regulator [Streptomyces sp. 549]MDK1476699.1 TetR/AcrR family transcriptional regulator [Streptomyces sp. 549]
MPAARESLLSAAQAALTHRPWATVRMVDVAAVAGVSRQTLYNEFSSKEGLGAALVERRTEAFVRGAATAAATARRAGGDPAVCCASAAGWLVYRAKEEPLVRAALTGSWDARLPLPGDSPELLLRRLCERLVAVLGGPEQVPPRAVETGLRLALSYVVAPPAEPEVPARVADTVTALLRRRTTSPY